MSRKLALAGLLALLLLIPSSAVLAQGGQGDQLVIGQTFVLPSGQELNGNLTVIGGEATLEEGSTVTGNVAVLGGRLTVAGTVRGDVVVFGGVAVLQEGAVIEGRFASFGGSLERAPGAVIRGESFGVPGGPGWPGFVPWTEWTRWWTPSRPLGVLARIVLWPLEALGWGLVLALLGVFAVLVAPRPMERIATAASTEPALSFGVGLLTLVVAALVGTLLLIACCFGLLIWAVAGAAWLVGWLGVGLWVGQRLLQALKVNNRSSLAEVALGVFLVTVLARLPLCIGFLFGVVFGSIGLGAVVLTRFGTRSTGAAARRSETQPTVGGEPGAKITSGQAETPVPESPPQDAGNPGNESREPVVPQGESRLEDPSPSITD